jgi:hypothetical protein
MIISGLPRSGRNFEAGKLLRRREPLKKVAIWREKGFFCAQNPAKAAQKRLESAGYVYLSVNGRFF